MKTYLQLLFILICLLTTVSLFSQSDSHESSIQYFTINSIKSRIEINTKELNEIIITELEKKNLQYIKDYNPYSTPYDILKNPQKIILVDINIEKLYSTFQCANIQVVLKSASKVTAFFKEETCSGFSMVKKSKCIDKIKSNLKNILSAVSLNDLRLRVYIHDSAVALQYTDTNISKDSLYAIIKKSDNPFVHHYESLDTVGGIYDFGIMETDSTYNLIITDSNRPTWVPGLVKGYIDKNDIKINSEEFPITWYQLGKITLHPIARIKDDSTLIVKFNEERLKLTSYFKRTKLN